MIRTAIAGTEKSLPYYLNKIRKSPGFLITGVLSPDSPVSLKQNQLLPFLVNNNPEDLTGLSDALIVTDNAKYFYETIVIFLKKSRHVLIMPDSSISFSTVKKLTKIADEAGVVIHFDHNSLDFAIKEKLCRFIPKPEHLSLNCHINYNHSKYPRNIFDILLREICLIFSLNPFNPKKVSASSVPSYSNNPDFINVRIEFENGTSAGITTSFLTLKESRILEIYSAKKMIHYDLNMHSVTMIDKDFSVPLTIKPEEIRSMMKNEDAFANFFKNISKELISGNRFTTGFAAHQLAAGIIDQIKPCPVQT